MNVASILFSILSGLCFFDIILGIQALDYLLIFASVSLGAVMLILAIMFTEFEDQVYPFRKESKP
jgi:CBS-domain-containing membrane protein